jgi:biopolymer transport protein TolR
MALSDLHHNDRYLLSEINVTPLVDVMLVLLVIFMITAPLLHTGLRVTLPKTRTVEAQSPPTQAVIITIDQQGNIYLGTGTKMAHQPISADDLALILRERLSHSPDKRVFVRGDGETPYRVIAYVLGLCRQAGASVNLVTEPLK